MDQGTNRKQASKPSTPKEDPMGTARDTLVQITLAVNLLTLGIYYFLGVGEEITIGVGAAKKIYYMAGYNADMWLLASVIFTAISFIIISISRKK